MVWFWVWFRGRIVPSLWRSSDTQREETRDRRDEVESILRLALVVRVFAVGAFLSPQILFLSVSPDSRLFFLVWVVWVLNVFVFMLAGAGAAEELEDEVAVEAVEVVVEEETQQLLHLLT